MTDERKAVKYHDRLVEALKWALAMCLCPGGGGSCSSCSASRALLAEIEADKP